MNRGLHFVAHKLIFVHYVDGIYGNFSQPSAPAMQGRSFLATAFDLARPCVAPPLLLGSALLSAPPLTPSFYRATRIHSADYAVARCLSVRLSVRPSHAGIVCKRLYISTNYLYHRVAHHSSFSTPNETAIF